MTAHMDNHVGKESGEFLDELADLCRASVLDCRTVPGNFSGLYDNMKGDRKVIKRFDALLEERWRRSKVGSNVVVDLIKLA